MFFNKYQKNCDAFVKKVNSLDFSAHLDKDLPLELADDIYHKAAAVKEIIKRKTGLVLFDSQLRAAYGLYNKKIVELATGEGKTLSAVMAAILFCLDGRKVSVLVFNDYLAKRDGTANSEIFKACGITCGFITAKSDKNERKQAYKSDVLYIAAKEQGFDYLRNSVIYDKDDYLYINFDVCIVDEADSILIDESGVPLVLAGGADSKEDFAVVAHKTVQAFDSGDYDINPGEKQIWLTDSGVKKAETELELDNLYNDRNFAILSALNTALEANFLFEKDKDYIVKDGEIKIIDESTGRVALGRRFPDSLQHAVEVKEGLKSGDTTKIYNTITVQSFLNGYKTLSGMTGTAMTSAKEIWSMYETDTVAVESHVPCIRVDMPDEVFEKKADKENAIIQLIRSEHQKGRPILLGTSSVKESEFYSAALSDIPHAVLNARDDSKEAEIIANAGLPFNLTISTNMAGRGVDIKLGGEDEKYHDKVAQCGGLLVISSGINRSRRIDNQLRGRAGRQGDPGESRFFISLEDENIAPFVEFNSREDLLNSIREAQKVLEGNDAEVRYMLRKYSLITDDQRRVISDILSKLLFLDEPTDFTQRQDKELYDSLCEKHGEQAVQKAEKQLLIYFTVQGFADYLGVMEEVKNGIHLVIVGGKNPLDEFNRIAIANFEEMREYVKTTVLEYMKTAEITENGIDMDAAGLKNGAVTWTYMIDESSNQFSRLPYLMKALSHKLKKATGLLDRFDQKIK